MRMESSPYFTTTTSRLPLVNTTTITPDEPQVTSAQSTPRSRNQKRKELAKAKRSERRKKERIAAINASRDEVLRRLELEKEEEKEEEREGGGGGGGGGEAGNDMEVLRKRVLIRIEAIRAELCLNVGSQDEYLERLRRKVAKTINEADGRCAMEDLRTRVLENMRFLQSIRTWGGSSHS